MCSKNIIILLTTILFFFFPPKTLSAEVINIVNFPTTKIAGEEFEVNFNATTLSVSSNYYMKGLGGDVGSGLTEVDTWNNAWVQQNGSWSSMPTFSSNSEGSASAILKVRFDPSVSTNSKEFKLRIRKTDSSENIDSNLVSIAVIAATPTPTQAPTNPPTTSPTKTATPTQTATTTPKPTPTKTSTTKPTSTPTEESSETNEPENLISDIKIIDATPIGMVAGATTTKKSPIVAIILIISGIGFLGYGGYLLYNMKHAKIENSS